MSACLLEKVREAGVQLGVRGGDLAVKAAPGVLTPDRVARIREHKAVLLELVKAEAAPSPKPARRGGRDRERVRRPCTTAASLSPGTTGSSNWFGQLPHTLRRTMERGQDMTTDRKPMVELATLWQREKSGRAHLLQRILNGCTLLMFDDGEHPHPTREGETVHVWKLLLQERDTPQRPAPPQRTDRRDRAAATGPAGRTPRATSRDATSISGGR